MKLIGSRARIKPLDNQTVESRILRTQRYSPDPMIYWVLELGDPRKIDPEIAPGCRCLFNPSTSNRHPVGDGSFIVEAKDILMVWT